MSILKCLTVRLVLYVAVFWVFVLSIYLVFVHDALSFSKETVSVHVSSKSLHQFPVRVNPSTHSASCDAGKISQHIHHIEDLQQYNSCQRIFYNRVPKCGSRAVLSVLGSLAQNNNFTFVSLPKVHGNYDIHDNSARENFTLMFEKIAEPFLVSQHVNYINFKRYNLLNPLYINVIRDPVERAISHYYYKLYGSGGTVTNITHPEKVMTLDECISQQGSACRYVQNIVLPFFCGHAPFCRERSGETLARAKSVIRSQYMVVGLTEDLPAFMDVLETMMPRIFHNAPVVYNKTREDLLGKFKTTKRYEVSEKTRKILLNNMATEYNLYKFVKQRFYDQLHKMQLLQSISEGKISKWSNSVP